MANHEGIKKSVVSSGNVRKNMLKAYHYEPYQAGAGGKAGGKHQGQLK